MSDPLRKIYVDERMESYEGYLPDDWATVAFENVKPNSALDRLLVDLLLSWRTTAYTASMPATTIKVAQSTLLGYAKFTSPDGSIVAFADAILGRVSRNVPELVENRKLRAQMASELVTVAQGIRTQRADVTPQMPLEPIWQDFLKQDAFAMSVWSSQRVSYLAFYNAYEALLVDCVKTALGISHLRSTAKDFKDGLRAAFSKDISAPCWTNHEVNNARLVRHALSHAGGRETTDLKKQKHGIKLMENVLQVVPEDNHKLLRRLRTGVETIVDIAASDPKFS